MSLSLHGFGFGDIYRKCKFILKISSNILKEGSGLCVVVFNYSTHAVEIFNGSDGVKIFNGPDVTKANSLMFF
jgi:hypothetical protein